MDFGLTGKLGEYYLAQQYQKNGAAGKSSGWKDGSHCTTCFGTENARQS